MVTLLWPLFIAACEAQKKKFRDIARELFDKLYNWRGTRNIWHAYTVCEHVWANPDPEIEWQEVARQEKICVLLA